MIPGISYQSSTSSRSHLCIVEFFSTELQDVIRRELSKICHGQNKATSRLSIYSYKATINEFLKRYNDKSPEIKIGMIGELLTHVLVFHYLPNIRPATPFFNMEEASIKKGFDLIAINSEDNSFWITEVKSGRIGKSDKVKKIHSLINLAINDLKDRLPDSDATIWVSAMNNVNLALSSGDSGKDMLLKYLNDFWEENQTNSTNTSKANAILVPVLIEDIVNSVDFLVIQRKASKILQNPPFNGHIVFAIQKSTISKIEFFLTEEAK